MLLGWLVEMLCFSCCYWFVIWCLVYPMMSPWPLGLTELPFWQHLVNHTRPVELALGILPCQQDFIRELLSRAEYIPFLVIRQPVFNWICRKTLAGVFFNHSFLSQLASHGEELVSELNTAVALWGLKCDWNPVLLDSISA